MESLFSGHTVTKQKTLINILKQLSRESSEHLPNWSSLLDTAFSLTESVTNSLCVDSSDQAELEKLAVELWNRTSILRSRGKLEPLTYAKLRHVSFQVVVYFNEAQSEERIIKKQILMGLKTAKGWIECQDFDYAEAVLNVLNQSVQRLRQLVSNIQSLSVQPDVLKKQVAEIDLNVFRVLCLQAEVFFHKSKNTGALSELSRIKEMLWKFPNEAVYLSMLCYNFGVECYQKKLFENAVAWLRESYGFGKESPDISAQVQARTLRLLANCYMEWGCDGWQEQALNAASLANKEHIQPAGLYLKLELLLRTQDSTSSIQQVFEELLQHPDCHFDMCVSAIQLCKKHKRPDLVFEMRHKLCKKFDVHPEYGQLLVNILDVLLESSQTDYQKTFVEESIIAHNTSSRLDGATIKQFHVQFWRKAADYFERGMFKEALMWYNYSLNLFPALTHSEPNVSKLHRNLATCYLHLGEPDQALKAIEVAQRCEPSNPCTYYILFKVALQMNDTEKALTSLQKLVEMASADSSEEPSLICLAAHLALEQEKTELAQPALECLVAHSRDDRSLITALRCLLRLMLAQLDLDHCTDFTPVLAHIRTAYNKLLTARDKETLSSAEIHEEASWFMKLTWNLALQSRADVFGMKELFNICIQLLGLSASDGHNISKHQHCLLMSCAACLQLARDHRDPTSLKPILEEVLLHVEEYRQMQRTLESKLWCQEGALKSCLSTEKLFLLFEFEALTKLQDDRAEAVLEKAVCLPNPDPKLFHTLAALAVDPPADNKRLSIRALKKTVGQHLQLDSPDWGKCSADVRNLVELAMSCNDDECLTYLRETLEIIDKRAKNKYPEIEILWLMTKSWNYGLHLYNFGKYQEAEEWCGLSLRFLQYLSTLKEDYEDQMTSLYQEILSCLERQSTSCVQLNS